MALLESASIDVLIWEKAEYCWPDFIDGNMKNWFSVKTERVEVRIIEPCNKLHNVIAFREGYNLLPCVYNGVVKKSLLEEVAEKSINGKFFNSISPDVYSGIALSQVLDKYVYVNYLFSVNGASSFSNGSSFTRPQTNECNSPTSKFLSEYTYEYDNRVKMGPSVTICVMGEYLMVKKFIPEFNLPEPDWDRYIRTLIQGAKSSQLPDAILESARHSASMIASEMKIPEQVH
jgi:hypothetical protein